MLLTVIGVRNVVNKWSPDNKPLVTNILPPGVKFPDFKALNSKEPQSAWRMKFGTLTGPWEGQHCLYLIDEHFNRYTWPSPISTIGSSIAVEEIVDHIKTVRKFRGPNVYAVVELRHIHFPNRFKADRERPFFQVMRTVELGANRPEELPAPDQPLPELTQQGAPADAKTVEPVTLAEEMGDKCPY
jgi:hypothetical protein